MARYKNTFNLSAGFNIAGEEPIDSRLVVEYKSDLTEDSTWEGAGLYNGMTVTVLETKGLYILTDKNNWKQETAWVGVKGGGGDAYITNDIKDKDGNIIIPKGTSLTGAVSALVGLINSSDGDISIVKNGDAFSIRLNGISNF